jgi:hypothetical protein
MNSKYECGSTFKVFLHPVIGTKDPYLRYFTGRRETQWHRAKRAGTLIVSSDFFTTNSHFSFQFLHTMLYSSIILISSNMVYQRIEISQADRIMILRKVIMGTVLHIQPIQ